MSELEAKMRSNADQCEALGVDRRIAEAWRECADELAALSAEQEEPVAWLVEYWSLSESRWVKYDIYQQQHTAEHEALMLNCASGRTRIVPLIRAAHQQEERAMSDEMYAAGLRDGAYQQDQRWVEAINMETGNVARDLLDRIVDNAIGEGAVQRLRAEQEGPDPRFPPMDGWVLCDLWGEDMAWFWEEPDDDGIRAKVPVRISVRAVHQQEAQRRLVWSDDGHDLDRHGLAQIHTEQHEPHFKPYWLVPAAAHQREESEPRCICGSYEVGSGEEYPRRDCPVCGEESES